MIKLIASDIDGTLLTNHGQIVPERTADLIRRLIDKGIYFTAASGRKETLCLNQRQTVIYFRWRNRRPHPK